MTRRRLAASALLAFSLLVLSGCMGRSAAESRARQMLTGFAQEASSTAGPLFDTDVRYGGVRKTASDYALPLSAWDATYSVTITSKECPAFRQDTVTGGVFGPGAAGRGGGIHDWSLFRVLSQWEGGRRLAFERYYSGRGNPGIRLVSRLSAPWAGSDWATGTPLGTSLRDIGAKSGFDPDDLALVELADPRRELIAFDAKKDQWILLAVYSGGGWYSVTQ